MPILIVGLLTVFAIAVVIYPFFRWTSDPEDRSEDDAIGAGTEPDSSDFRKEREEIYEEIRALELEYQIGTLEESEHRRQLQQLRVDAARSIQNQELSRLDLVLEERILARRSSDDEVETDHKPIPDSSDPNIKHE